LARLHGHHAALLDGIRTGKALSPELEAELKRVLDTFVEGFGGSAA